MQFQIENMTCGGCVRGVTKAIQAVDAAATIEVNLPEQRVDVTTRVSRDQIVAALNDAGFTPS